MIEWLRRLTIWSLGLFRRTKRVYTEGSVSPSGRLVARKISTDGTEAIRVADSQKRSSAIDLSLDGTLSYAIEGPSPQGEIDTLDVCKALVSRLNLAGGRWSEPVRPEGEESGIDCVSRDDHQPLNIQVTRAVSSKRVWQELRHAGRIAVTTTVQRAADDLLQRARDKSRKVPRDQLVNTVLAIDAMDTASHTLGVVLDEFRHRHGPAVRQLGFKEVWIVGPLEALTIRVDQ